jgi:hypothetical protein
MKLRRVFVATALAAVLAMPVSSFAQPQDKDDKKEEREKREGHPVIREAIRQLEHTKDELEHKAASDFHGHKAMAIKSINEALEHLHQALASDKD